MTSEEICEVTLLGFQVPVKVHLIDYVTGSRIEVDPNASMENLFLQCSNRTKFTRRLELGCRRSSKPTILFHSMNSR